jgi:flavodoxin
MNKTLVVYFSRTGNTRQVAEAIYDAIEGVKEIRPLEKAASLDPFDLIFVGFPIQMHSVPFKAEQFLKTIPAGGKIALFCTHGALPGHRLSREAIEYAVVLAARAKVLGTYSCRGKISVQALDVLGRSPEHQEWVDMAASAGTHPDTTDLAEARLFAQRMEILSAHGGY